MRVLLMNLGLAAMLGLAWQPARAQQAADAASGVDTGASRKATIESRRALEQRRPTAEREKREGEAVLLDAERRARDKRGDVDSRRFRLERNLVRRNESAADHELRLRDLQDEKRRVDAERWQVEDLERQSRTGHREMGRPGPVGGSLR